jgi:hypothetical protein
MEVETHRIIAKWMDKKHGSVIPVVCNIMITVTKIKKEIKKFSCI